MKPRILISALMLFCGALLSSCISGTIVATGKSYEHLNHDHIKVDRVRRELGKPDFSRKYEPAVAIKDTKEFKKYEASGGYGFVHGDADDVESLATGLCEVYVREGPFFDMLRGEGYGMASGLTLGVGDIVLLPMAIKERAELAGKRHAITFWYSQEGLVLGILQGDIRDHNARW